MLATFCTGFGVPRILALHQFQDSAGFLAEQLILGTAGREQLACLLAEALQFLRGLSKGRNNPVLLGKVKNGR